MKITQLHTLVNTVTQEVLGEATLVQEDLSNVVDLGKEIIDTDNVDNYVKKLVNHIGKVIFVNRLYAGGVPSVLMDSWEFGSILEKISADMPSATESDTWKLTDGETYDPNVFHQPEVSAKFFNSRVTFEIPMSFTEIQVKESFSNQNQLNGFISMLITMVENSMTVKIDSLVMRTINNMIGETLSTGTVNTKVNLLELYNATVDTPILAVDTITNPDFIRFATYMMGLYSDRLTKISTLFNGGAKERFTPKDLQHIVLLSDFSKASSVFLTADVYNAENVVLPTHESVPYWQGTGLTYDFNDTSSIDVKTSTGVDIKQGGIIGIMFDRDSLGVTNLDRRVTTNYNPKAEFFSNWYKFDCGYFNDLNENFVVFYVADTE